jgi:hypothetical protein
VLQAFFRHALIQVQSKRSSWLSADSKPGTMGRFALVGLSGLLVNTDDAYGFPPFRYFAPAIAIGGEGYVRLREQARELVAKFLTDVRVRRLARDDFSWADAIPELVAGRKDAWLDQGWTA